MIAYLKAFYECDTASKMVAIKGRPIKEGMALPKVYLHVHINCHFLPLQTLIITFKYICKFMNPETLCFAK